MDVLIRKVAIVLDIESIALIEPAALLAVQTIAIALYYKIAQGFGRIVDFKFRNVPTIKIGVVSGVFVQFCS